MEIKKDWFWGTMYGGKPKKDCDEIVKIDVKSCEMSADGTSFCYVWGWPGPDCNFYDEADYGKTWAWELEDFGLEDIEDYLLEKYREK